MKTVKVLNIDILNINSLGWVRLRSGRRLAWNGCIVAWRNQSASSSATSWMTCSSSITSVSSSWEYTRILSEKSRNGNFTRLYWAIRDHKFVYPGRKDTIKACIYVKELVRFMLYRLEHHEHGVELYNCCFEPAYTIQHIVEAMKKVTGLTQFVPDIPNWVIMLMARAAMLLGSPMGICPARVKKLQISTNICG